MTLIEELKLRKLFNNVTNKENLEKAIKNKSHFYLGIDPTGDCLHLGHYQNIILIKMLIRYGLKPIVLIGGATGVVGDPSGKDSERILLDDKTLKHNVDSLKKQIKKLTSTNIKIIDNYDWWSQINSLTMLRDIGKKININYMLSKDSVKERIETGLSYTEFSYMLLQAYDFLFLYKNKKVMIQLGGSDQWGNITAGIELIRKELGTDHNAVGLTTELIVDKQGKKFGKSSGKPIWLDNKRTSSYEIYQFLLNQDDDMTLNLLKRLTTYTIKEIDEIEKKHLETKHLRLAQKELARNIITNLHGENNYKDSVKITEAIFKNRVSDLTENQFSMMMSGIESFKIKGNKSILEELESSNFTSSRRETREFIKSSALKINGDVCKDENLILDKKMSMHNKYYLIQLGKKKAYIFNIK